MPKDLCLRAPDTDPDAGIGLPYLRNRLQQAYKGQIVRRKKGKMKKEVAVRRSVLMVAVALLSLLFSEQMTVKAQAAIYEQAAEKEVRKETLIPGKRLVKMMDLNSEAVTQIPKYIVEDGTPYVLDESSIVVEVTGRSSSEGANVVTTSRKVENLPDNDLERIEKTITHNGTPCDLLYVMYEVTQEDEDRIPVAYSALCEYGGLETYSKSYPSAWQATFWYDAYETAEGMEVVTEQKYEHTEGTAEDMVKIIRGKDSDRGKDKEEPLPKPEVKRFELKKIKPGEKEEEKSSADYLVPLAGGILGACLILPFIIWFSILTAPVFALKKGERYRYIGQARMKKTGSAYAAYMTEALVNRADIPVFKIKVPERVRKKVREGALQVRCPNGRWITLICGKEVGFTLERE